jgi:hypothetical protein
MNVTDVITRMKDHQTKWWEHMERIEGERSPEILFKYDAGSERDPGKPQKRWKCLFLI